MTSIIQVTYRYLVLINPVRIIIVSKASDSVKLQIQKAMRERDQANSNTMQIRADFEKLLLQSNQVRNYFSYQEE